MSEAAVNREGAMSLSPQPAFALDGARGRRDGVSAAAAATNGAAASTPDGAPRRVLVVDDDASILRMLRLIFEDGGFEVATAVNGQEALDRISEHDPGVIVLDLEMPVMDGRACFRELRALGHAMPVLILSAYGAERARAELHADASLRKPFEPQHLVDEVQRLLEAR